jgi:acyl-CoA thioesterase
VTTTHDLRVATRLVQRQAGTFALDVPDGWQQGRGAFGGLVMSALARAAMASEPDRGRVLRSMTGEIVGPVLPGPAELSALALRIGNAVSTWHVQLAQAGEVQAVATIVMGRARGEDQVAISRTPPTMPPWQPLARLYVPGVMPTFLEHFDLRPTAHPPFTGEQEGRAQGWVRTMVRPPSFDAADLIALADAWWPSLFSAMTAPRPMATLGFTLQLLVDPQSLDPELPVFHDGVARAGHEGYVFDHRELWSADGRLVAVNPQTFVVIK